MEGGIKHYRGNLAKESLLLWSIESGTFNDVHAQSKKQEKKKIILYLTGFLKHDNCNEVKLTPLVKIASWS